MSTTTATRIPAFLPVPTAPSHKFLLQVAVGNKQVIHITKLQAMCVSINHAKTPPLKLFASTSSSSPAVDEEEDQEERQQPSISDDDNDAVLVQPELSTSDQDPGSISPVRGCQACGKAEIERGCNGEGRIQGGIATVPGFGWWPIKAYRPCPSYLSTGGRYRRSGQSMDEIGFGGGGRPASSSGNGENAESRKRKLKKLGSSKPAAPKSLE